MTRASDPSRRSTVWTLDRPKRPPGIRLFNWVGAQARRLGWRNTLRLDEILDKARRRTGLSDWGDEYFLEPLAILVRAFEDEANLTPFGRLMIKGILTGCVETRLQVREYVRVHPEATQASLASPLIVVGMPRTGTTLLYNLLAQDPDARPLLGWESMWPAPPKPHRDTRRRAGRLTQRSFERLAPELQHIHPFHAEGPEECTWLMAHTLVSPIFLMFGHLPTYEDWLWGLGPSDWVKPYQDYVTQLLVLQHQRGGRHWVLKSPVHFMSLGPLLDTVPGARVVLTDRNPNDVVPSACSLFALMQGLSSDSVDRGTLGRGMVERLSQGLRRAEDVRANNSKRVLKVRFRDLVKDQVGTVRQIYDRFGIGLTPEVEFAIQRWIADTPHSASHKYALDQFGLTEAFVAEHFTGLGRD